MARKMARKIARKSSKGDRPGPVQADLGKVHPGKPGKAALAKARRKGRLVRNHSTNLPGLIVILERLCDQPGVETLTPAVIGRAKSHAPRFRLKVSVPTQGGFKLIARQGKSFQEVFVTTHLDKSDLEEAIQASLS